MQKLTATPVVWVVGLGLGLCAQAQTMTYAQNEAAYEKIQVDYQAARGACANLTGNARDVCEVEAKGNLQVAQARLIADYLPSVRARRVVRHTKSRVRHAVAVQKCVAFAAASRESCLAQAGGTP